LPRLSVVPRSITTAGTGGVMTLINGFLTFVLPLTNGYFRDPVYPAYVWFATIETVCTLVIIWQAWTWSRVVAAVSSN